jgi:hypothetical protein
MSLETIKISHLQKNIGRLSPSLFAHCVRISLLRTTVDHDPLTILSFSQAHSAYLFSLHLIISKYLSCHLIQHELDPVRLQSEQPRS